MKIRIPGLKPRNPVALAARQRNAGAHEKTEKTRRRDARQALKQQLKGGREEDFSPFFLPLGVRHESTASIDSGQPYSK